MTILRVVTIVVCGAALVAVPALWLGAVFVASIAVADLVMP